MPSVLYETVAQTVFLDPKEKKTEHPSTRTIVNHSQTADLCASIVVDMLEFEDVSWSPTSNCAERGRVPRPSRHVSAKAGEESKEFELKMYVKRKPRAHHPTSLTESSSEALVEDEKPPRNPMRHHAQPHRKTTEDTSGINQDRPDQWSQDLHIGAPVPERAP